MSGYARFHRSLIGHPAFRNDAEAMAFAYMVLRASWKPTRVRYKERGISLKRGQLSLSQRDMALALDRDKAWVERLWKRLRAEAMIEVASEAGVAVITICNYDKYQHSNDTAEAVDEAPAEARVRQGQGTEQAREEYKKEEEGEAKASPRAKRAGGQGSHLPDDWQPSRFADGTVSREIIDRRGSEWARRVFESFRNHWRSANGPTARKRDWQAAWANWVIEQDKRDGRHTDSMGRNGGAGSQPRSRTIDAALAFIADGQPH